MTILDPMALSERERRRLLAQAIANPGVSADPTGGMAPQSIGPEAGPQSAEELLSDEAFLASLAPMDKERERLERQQMQAEALMNSNMASKRTSPGGALFAGVGDILNTVNGIRRAHSLKSDVEGLEGREAKGASNRTRLSRALELDKRKAEGEQAGLARQDAAARAAAEQAARAEQERLDREARARENALNRGLQRELHGADAKRAEDKAGADAKSVSAKFAMDLRKELNALPDVKSYNEAAVAYDKMQRAASKPSAAGDLSLIFSYMKTLDPGSTVREGEFANAQNATGVDGKVVNLYNQIRSGQRLSPAQRADFLSQAGELFRAHEARAQPIFESYSGLAERAGISPGDVLPRPAAPRQAAAGEQAPQPQPPTDRNAALEWLEKNPNHPKAKEVLQSLEGGG
jgi:hypothetical protein